MVPNNHTTPDNENGTSPLGESVFDQLMQQEHDHKMLLGALYYAQLGIPVFPIEIVTNTAGKTRKKPCIKEWPVEASTNIHQVGEWWGANGPFRGKLIGAVTGERSGWCVVDVDVKNSGQGAQSLDKLADEFMPITAGDRVFGPLAPELRLAPSGLARTRSGGFHLWYRLGEHAGIRGKRNIRGLPSIDFQATGQYVVVAPSDGYEWIKQLPAERGPDDASSEFLATAPVISEKLLARLKEGREPGSGNYNFDDDGDDDGVVRFKIQGKGVQLLKEAADYLAELPDNGTGNESIYQAALDLYPYVVLGELNREQVDHEVLTAIAHWDYEDGARPTLNSAWTTTQRRKFMLNTDLPDFARPSGGRNQVAPQLVAPIEPNKPADSAPDGADQGQAVERGTTYKTNYSGAFNSAKVRGLDDAAAAEYAAKYAEQAVATAAAAAARAKPKLLPMLPEELWEARPVFKHIQRAAQSRKASPDAVLHCTLTRIAALRSHKIVFDSGEGDGQSSLNFFNAIVGPSGGYKSTAAQTAWDLTDPPFCLAWNGELPIGTGEGLLEAYMGYVDKETGEDNKDGTPKTRSVKEQVRYNNLFYIDEGQTLNTLVFKRKDATLGGVLRQLWGGATTGMTNAKEETSRKLQKGTYSLGIAVGYQPEIVVELFDDAKTGMPQRFLWSWSKNPNAPRKRVPWPGKLTIDTRVLMASDTKVIDFPESIKDEIDAEASSRLRCESPDLTEMNGHEPFMLSKIAALLALLDSRTAVNVEDWRLAKIIWHTSCEVRDELMQQAVDKKIAENAQKRAAYVRTQVEATVATKNIIDPNVQRIAHRVWTKVQEAEADGNKLTEAAVWRQIASRDRPYKDDVMKYLLNCDWIELKDPPTESRPGAKQSTPLLSLGNAQPRVE